MHITRQEIEEMRSTKKEVRKVLLTLLVTTAACTGAVLSGNLFPHHFLLVSTTFFVLFYLVIMPLWPARWTYAPDLTYGGILSGWFAFVPTPAKQAFRVVQITVILLVVGLVSYLGFAEVVKPLIHLL